jgi:hypothetical protein
MRALKKQGFRNGVSDLVLFYEEKLYCLELKAPKGRPTVMQLLFLDDVKRNGAYTCVAQGLDEALGALEAWGLLKKEGRGITHHRSPPSLAPFTPRRARRPSDDCDR